MLAEALRAVSEQIAALKNEATALKGAMSAAGTATREQQQATAQQAASVEGLSKKVKQLTEEERRLEDVRKRYKKLTDEQIERVNAFQQALRGSTQQQMAAVNAIEVETKSYNELNAMYNALKDSLNAMTVAERQNTEAGKAMTVQSAKIYDTMNELQKATGKYTLQVGKYRAAFDGLGYSFQQILREAPSALNLNQFFLAISNNVPMFIDQLKAFNEEQKAIKTNLAQMTEGTKEYQEQLGKVMSVGQKLGRTLMSWQTLVLVGLLIIRNWEKIVALFQKFFKKIEDGFDSLVRMRQVVNEIDANVANSISKVVVELGELTRQLDNVTEGSVEWKNITERINEIMGDNYDLTGKMPGQIKKITNAYIEQAEQLAKNQFVVQKISENADRAFKRERAVEAIVQSGDVKSAAKIFGYEEGSKEYKELERAANTSMPLPSQNDPNEKVWEVVDGKPRRVGYDKWMTDMLNRTFDELDGELLTSQDISKLWDRYYKPMRQSTTNGDDSEKPEATERDITEKYWEAIRARLKIEQEGYKLEKSLLKVDRDEKLANLEEWQKEQHAALEENHKNGFITDEEYRKKIAEIDQQYSDIGKGIEDDYWKAVRALRSKNMKEMAEEREKNAKEDAKAQYKALADSWQEERAQLVERGAKRKELIEKEIDAEVNRLNVMLELERSLNGEIMTDEEKTKIQEWIKLLEQFKKAGDFRTINVGQIFGKGGENLGKRQRGNYSSITELLWPDLDKDQTAALNSAFDQAKAALNSWMDARKAAADQAKELADDEVSSAEQALNREIELRNQGYANDVALREKELADAKEQQKKALEMQQKAKTEELAINTALEASNMAVAVANLFKQFGLYAIPMAAVMLGAWGVAKYSAFSQIKSTKYREGGVMLLEGGSHESGHDVNLGIGPDGSNLRAEGGEYFAVINKRSSRKYGSQIPAVVNALNGGVFEDRYIKTSDAVGMMGNVGLVGNMGEAVDLSAVESGVGELVKQGEQKWSIESDWKVMRYKNLTRRVKING